MAEIRKLTRFSRQWLGMETMYRNELKDSFEITWPGHEAPRWGEKKNDVTLLVNVVNVQKYSLF